MVLFDHVYVDVFGELGCGSVVGRVSSRICCITLIEFLRFVNEFIEDQGLHGPINSGVGFFLTRVILRLHSPFHRS